MQHSRFYIAVAAGLVAFGLIFVFSREIATIAGGDVFFVVYLVGMILMAWRSSLAKLRNRARNEDEGIVAIVGLTALAIAFSFASMFSLLGKNANPSTLQLMLAIASIPLGWAVLHMLFAYHYARLYYAPAGKGEGSPSDAGGLDFLDTPEPGIVEFMYFSFIIGATAQTADVNLRSTGFRKVVLFHGIASFVFNTVLLALAVNVAASLL
jgi:uncharacterized membrane protein